MSGKTPFGDLEPGFQQKLDTSNLVYSDKLKAERWFALEKMKFDTKVHLTDHFFGDGEAPSETNKKPGDTAGDQFDIKEIDPAVLKEREVNFKRTVEV